MRVLGFFVLALIGWVGCKHAEPPPQDASSVTAESPPAVEAAATAPLFEGLGDFSHPITVSSPLAQRYFDQGMILSFGFNHAEAERSFRYAAELDESCAMCWWGVAYVLGPNINAPMSPEAGAQAWEALGTAQALATKVSAKEQDYITALSARYVEALYLQVGKPKAAERLYREDLAVFPNNGWALFGLAQALDAQGKRSEAATVRAEFEQAWSKADVELTASWFM